MRGQTNKSIDSDLCRRHRQRRRAFCWLPGFWQRRWRRLLRPTFILQFAWLACGRGLVRCCSWSDRAGSMRIEWTMVVRQWQLPLLSSRRSVQVGAIAATATSTPATPSARRRSQPGAAPRLVLHLYTAFTPDLPSAGMGADNAAAVVKLAGGPDAIAGRGRVSGTTDFAARLGPGVWGHTCRCHGAGCQGCQGYDGQDRVTHGPNSKLVALHFVHAPNTTLDPTAEQTGFRRLEPTVAAAPLSSYPLWVGPIHQQAYLSDNGCGKRGAFSSPLSKPPNGPTHKEAG